MTLLAVAHDLTRMWVPESGLSPVSFELSAGELVAVTGPSGSGKSTLLALLAGWTAADGGTLERLGAWTEPGTWRATAIAPQVIAPIDELTVLENVALPLRLSGIDWRRARRAAMEVIERLDLVDEARRSPRDTSLGQQQRMGLARAAVVAPVVLLADEPTSHQDSGHVDAILAVLGDLAAAGTCIVAASHDPAVAAAAASQLNLR